MPADYQNLNTTLIQTLRKKIEALRESEEKFRTIFENANDGILIADAKTRKFVFANSAICELLGYTKEELCKLGVKDIHLKKDLPYVTEQFTKLLQIKIEIAPSLPVLGKDGKIIYCDIGACPINISGKEFLVGFFRDVTERKKAEEAIKESEAKYKAIVENATDWIFLLDTKLRFISLNKAIANLFHKSVSETIGKSIFDAFPKEIAAGFARSNYEVIRSGRSKFAEEKMVVAGREFYINTNLNPIKNSKGKVTAVMGITRDITAQKKAEQALRDAEEKWTSLTRNTNDVIMIVDSKGIIRYINKTFPPYTPEETVGNSVYKYTLKEQHKIMKASLDRVFKTGKPVSYEVSSDIPKTGIIAFSTKVVPIIINKKVVKAILLSTNITGRKRAEEEVENAKVYLGGIIRSMNDALWIIDTHGKTLDVNPAAVKLYGCKSKEELIKKSPLDVAPKKDLKIGLKLIRDAFKKGHSSGEAHIIRKGGKEVPVSIRCSLMKDLRGKVTGSFAVLKDITERKKAEDKLRETKEKYEKEINELKRKLKARRKL